MKRCLRVCVLTVLVVMLLASVSGAAVFADDTEAAGFVTVDGKQVLCVSNTNGFEGYFVTEDAICRGGYEVEMFLYGRPQKFCDNADWHLMKQMTQSVKRLFEKE